MLTHGRSYLSHADDVIGMEEDRSQSVWDISSRKQRGLMYGVWDGVRHEHNLAFLFMKAISIYKIPPLPPFA